MSSNWQRLNPTKTVHLTGLTSGVVKSWWGMLRFSDWNKTVRRPHTGCAFDGDLSMADRVNHPASIYTAPMCCSVLQRPSFTFIHHEEPGLLQFFLPDLSNFRLWRSSSSLTLLLDSWTSSHNCCTQRKICEKYYTGFLLLTTLRSGSSCWHVPQLLALL